MSKHFTALRNLIFGSAVCALLFVLAVSDTHAKSLCGGISLSQERYDLGYGSKINFIADNSSSQVPSWQITSDGVVIHSGSGNSTGEIQFDKPGVYQIVFTVAASADHESHSDTAPIYVYPVKMTFLFNELKFSSLPQKGVETSGISLTVPVEVETIDGQPVVFERPVFNTAGIATTINGATKQSQVKLKPGKTLLTYEVSGAAALGGFIMFDFTDINGQVQSYALATEIK